MPNRSYIAVIDDDESLCRSLCRLLNVAGYHPVTFLSAEDFLEDTHRPKFGCLLIDIQLSGMSGIELHRRLVADGVSTPIIYITAYDDPAARAEAENSGCAAFFRKTDAGQDILQAIGRVTDAARRAGGSS